MILFLYGENRYLLQKRTRFLIDKFGEKYGDYNLSSMEAGEIGSVSDLESILSIVPFIGDRRMVVVKDFLLKTKKKELLDDVAAFLSGWSSEQVVLLIVEDGQPDARRKLFKWLKKEAQAEVFDELKGFEVDRYIKTRIQELGGSMDSRAISLLSLYVGSDLSRLEQEMEKLLLYAENRPITEDIVKELVSSSLQVEIFDLTDKLAKKQLKEALSSLSRLRSQGEDAGYIFAMILYQLRNLISIKEAKQRGWNPKEMASKCGLHPFVIKKTALMADRFELNQLITVLGEMLEVDAGVKQGDTTYEQELERLLLAISA